MDDLKDKSNSDFVFTKEMYLRGLKEMQRNAYIHPMHLRKQRKRLIMKRRGERCSGCAYGELHKVTTICRKWGVMAEENSYVLICATVKPYWHMACFEKKREV